MNKLAFIYALFISIFIQAPISYFFISLESLALGHGFIGAPDGVVIYLLVAISIAAFVMLAIGLPIYFFLKLYNYNTFLKVALIGFFIPVAVFCVIYFSFASYEGYSSGENYYGTYRDIVIDGKRTIWGWVKFLESMATFGVHGLLGAIVFHKLYTKSKNA